MLDDHHTTRISYLITLIGLLSQTDAGWLSFTILFVFVFDIALVVSTVNLFWYLRKDTKKIYDYRLMEINDS